VKFATGPSQISVSGSATPAAAPAPPAAGDVIKDTTTAGFMKDVIEASRQSIVLVDFWAEWCGPCKQLTPIIEKVVRSYGGKVKLVKMNIDQHPSIPSQLRVQSIPMVFAFRDGRPLDAFQGAQPESQVRAFIDRILGEEAGAGLEEALAAGQQALEAGDLQGAAEVFAAVLQEDKQNAVALAGLAKCYLQSGDAARAEQTIGLVPPDKQSAAAVAQVRAAIDLAKAAGSAGDTRVFISAIEANPKDHQARIDLAKAYAAHGKKSEALDQLLESIRIDRKWNEEAARKQLVQLFEAWGPKDAATLEGRRRLSSILFS
jgi:putative thioredoxin